jgi:dTDP-4-amino-4,6-dideoxygalactose transaminase
VRGGDLQVTDEMAEWTWPSPHAAKGKEMHYLKEALRETDWSHTHLCSTFEERFASFLGVRHAMLVPNGTTAVYLALVAAGIQKDQEVIIPGITWPSVVYAILQAGGIPRTVDISRDSLCMTGSQLESAISRNTFAVLATHLFGSQCDMRDICTVASRHKIHVIEDAAQSVGSVQAGRSCGSWGLAGAFSLNDRKVLACGEGGCVVTNSDQLNEELRRLQLILPERDSLPSKVPGTYKISEFQAAVALAQLDSLPTRLRIMTSGAELLTRSISQAKPTLTKQAQPPDVDVQSYFNYGINVVGASSEVLARRLSHATGLRVAKPYTPLWQVSDFVSLKRDRRVASAGLFSALPNCEYVYQAGHIRLPHFTLLARGSTIRRLGAAIVDCLNEARLASDE